LDGYLFLLQTARLTLDKKYEGVFVIVIPAYAGIFCIYR
jgi:hypothetical protein